jgi:predicted TPR repeat methyltransferase
MNQTTERLAQVYDSRADEYDAAMRKAHYFSPEWIARHVYDLDEVLECRVLDMACGTGINIKALCELRPGIRADGIDLSSKMIEHARLTNKYESLFTHDLNTPLLDIPSDTFDLVIAFGVLELLADIQVCLSECRRVLKDSGTLWVSFQRFERDDERSPPRQMSIGGVSLTGYSEEEILRTMSSLQMRVSSMDTVIGYVTDTDFACPFYVLSAHQVR